MEKLRREWVDNGVLHWEPVYSADEVDAYRAAVKALVDAAETFSNEAVVLSEDYLKAFYDYNDDDCIQGWDKARWKRAILAKKDIKKAIAAVERLEVE